MGGAFGIRARRPARWALAAVPLVLLACSDDGNPTAGEGSIAATTDDGTAGATTSTAGGTRPVPTVPPTTVEGQVATTSTVLDGSVTIAPPPVDPNAPTTSVVPPSTDLVGDPQPTPGVTVAPPPPPPTAADDPGACDRLAQFDIVGVISDTAGVNTSGVLVDDEVCRYATGSFVAEVHFVPLAVIRDDWFLREGIQPVGEVGSDAVGFTSFIPPGSPPRTGYTIAVEGGSRGVIVAVTGADAGRRVAAAIAIFANQAG